MAKNHQKENFLSLDRHRPIGILIKKQNATSNKTFIINYFYLKKKVGGIFSPGLVYCLTILV